MEAVVFDPVKKDLKFVNKDIPRDPRGNEVLVRVVYAGICGTDLHIIHGEFPSASKELVLGHEFSGYAEVVGPEVRHVKPFDWVVVDPNSGCRTCSLCTSGRYHLCQSEAVNSTIGIFKDGGWAEFCLVPSDQVHKIPDGITLEKAALAEPLSCIAHGWNRIGTIRIGQNILIQGCDIVGKLWAAALHLQGHKRVIVTEPCESRRKAAQYLGTGYKYLHPTELENYKADLIIDCSGSFAAIESAFNMLSPGGKLCIFGVAPPYSRLRFSPYDIYKRELTVVGVMINPFTIPDAFGLIEAMGSKYLDFDRLGVKEFALRDYKAAVESLRTGHVSKAIFKVSM